MNCRQNFDTWPLWENILKDKKNEGEKEGERKGRKKRRKYNLNDKRCHLLNPYVHQINLCPKAHSNSVTWQTRTHIFHLYHQKMFVSMPTSSLLRKTTVLHS